MSSDKWQGAKFAQMPSGMFEKFSIARIKKN